MEWCRATLMLNHFIYLYLKTNKSLIDINIDLKTFIKSTNQLRIPLFNHIITLILLHEVKQQFDSDPEFQPNNKYNKDH